ncbi:MDR family MFS transporter [Brevibacterium litoralis]|uniref:MDR family MFS transporter n=1 Tax=Brevibacterium litoralis TaxID=3138935 RepID=UPI0032ECEBF0
MPQHPVDDDGTPDTHAAAQDAPAPAMTPRAKIQAVLGIVMGMFVALLAILIVSPALPRIVSDLGGNQQTYTWIPTATMLTSALSTPLWGTFADRVSRKTLILAALGLTAVAATAAGFSPNTGVLITCRAFQGIGAGGLMSLGFVLISDITSPRERGKYMGIVGGVMACAQIGGPLAGGLITDAFGWRWNFFTAVPIALAAMVLLHRTLHLPHRPGRNTRIDFLGAALLSAGVALLLLWVTFAGHEYPWISWQSVVAVSLIVLLLGATALVERRHPDPIVPIDLFRDRSFTLGLVASIGVGMALFSTVVFLAQFLQLGRGLSPTGSGLLMIPIALGMFLGSNTTGRLIARTGRYKAILLVGAALMPTALLLLSTMDTDTPLVLVGTYLALLGLGIGTLMQNLVIVVQNTLPVERTGIGTSSVEFFRSLGGTLALSTFGALLSHTVDRRTTAGLAALDTPVEPVAGGTVPDLATLAAPVAEIVSAAYAEGFTTVNLFSVPVALVTFVAVIFLPRVPLGQESGLEQLARRTAIECDDDEAP